MARRLVECAINTGRGHRWLFVVDCGASMSRTHTRYSSKAKSLCPPGEASARLVMFVGSSLALVQDCLQAVSTTWLGASAFDVKLVSW